MSGLNTLVIPQHEPMRNTSDQSGTRRLRQCLVMAKPPVTQQVNLVQRPKHERKPVRDGSLPSLSVSGKEGHV
jgi:hypothetical protein